MMEKTGSCSECGKDLYYGQPKLMLVDFSNKETYDFCNYECMGSWTKGEKWKKKKSGQK